MPEKLSVVIFHRVYFVTFTEHLFLNRNDKGSLLHGPSYVYKKKSLRTKGGEARRSNFEWIKAFSESEQ